MRILAFIFLSFFLVKTAEAKITIFACESEWASLAKEIVGKKAKVFEGVSARGNPENMALTSNLIKSIRSANMVFCTGGGLEKKWLVQGIKRGGKEAKIKDDPNYLFLVYGSGISAKKHIPRPHLNPHNILPIAAEFTRRVKAIDERNADYYQKSYEKFTVKWHASMKLWEKAILPIRGMKVVVHNDSWLDLTKWLGLKIVAKIDINEGGAKNKQHLYEIARGLKKDPAWIIIFANHEDKTPIMWLSKKAQIPMILLPFSVSREANSSDLFSLYRTIVNSLLVRCPESVCPKLSILPTKSHK